MEKSIIVNVNWSHRDDIITLKEECSLKKTMIPFLDRFELGFGNMSSILSHSYPWNSEALSWFYQFSVWKRKTSQKINILASIKWSGDILFLKFQYDQEFIADAPVLPVYPKVSKYSCPLQFIRVARIILQTW